MLPTYKLSKLDDRKKIVILKKGIGIKSGKYRLEINKYGNKLKMEIIEQRNKKKLFLRHLLSLF